MSATFDVVVVGGGHNGLVCAAYLARGGRHVVVLERNAAVGGVARTLELMPGVRAPAAVNSVGRLAPRVARDLTLSEHGLRLIQPDVRLTALSPTGQALTLWADPARTADELRHLSAADAEAYPGFDADTHAYGSFLARINRQPPPDIERLRTSDLFSSAGLWWGYRGLGRRRAGELLRVLPLPIADHVTDFFETELLRAALAWRGVRYSALGTTDAGSTQTFLSDAAGTSDGAAGEMAVAVGGPGALSDALAAAAQAAGAQIRLESEVATVTLRDGRVSGVALKSGEEIEAPIVVSGADPKRTLLGLIDPAQLGPTMGWEAGNLRLGGSVSVVQLALADLPTFAGVGGDTARQRLSGRILVAPTLRALDRAADAAKGRHVADELLLEATIPTLLDPGLVSDGGAAKHVVNVLVQGTPYHRRDGDWDADREALGERVVARLEEVAPGIAALVVGRRVVTPLDLERDYGLTEGHPLHGEPSLDQWFAWRPLLGSARYGLPIDGLYLCGSGAHPGGGVTGTPGRLAAHEVLAGTRGGRLRVRA
jgi:phytoene dehydrogenase-like protein